MKTHPCNSFWQRIHRSSEVKAFPLRVMFELTYRCNFRCKHCYIPQSYSDCNELKTKEVFSILDQLVDIGCFYLGFTGGEPFIREDILDILWYAKKRGFEIIIYTNGSLINKKIAVELAHLRLNKVDITIPAMSKSVFERISGISGSRDKVFKAANLLYKKGVNLGFKTCVLQENENEIEDMQEFAHSLGASHRLDDMLFARLDGSVEPYKYRGPRLSARGYRPANCEGGLPPYAARLFECGVGINQAAITPSGELKMCVMIDYPKYKIFNASSSKPQAALQPDTGFLREAYSSRLEAYNLKDAWAGLKELVASIRPGKDYKCNICELKPHCKWCPARAWLFNRTFTSCEPEIHSWAKSEYKAN